MKKREILSFFAIFESIFHFHRLTKRSVSILEVCPKTWFSCFFKIHFLPSNDEWKWKKRKSARRVFKKKSKPEPNKGTYFLLASFSSQRCISYMYGPKGANGAICCVLDFWLPQGNSKVHYASCHACAGPSGWEARSLRQGFSKNRCPHGQRFLEGGWVVKKVNIMISQNKFKDVLSLVNTMISQNKL